MAHILAVDDDQEMLRLLRYVLEREGHEVTVAASGEEALRIVQSAGADLVILDVMLPGIDGFTVCERLRLARSVPILMLTGLVEEHDKVRGLDLGADDYLTKPFSPAELLARVRAVIRRVNPLAVPPRAPFTMGQLQIDVLGGKLRVEGRDVGATRSEVAIVATLAAQAGEPVPPRILAKQALNYDCDDQQARAILKVRVSRLRQKIGDDPQNPQVLVSVRGVGYALRVPEIARSA